MGGAVGVVDAGEVEDADGGLPGFEIVPALGDVQPHARPRIVEPPAPGSKVGQLTLLNASGAAGVVGGLFVQGVGPGNGGGAVDAQAIVCEGYFVGGDEVVAAARVRDAHVPDGPGVVDDAGEGYSGAPGGEVGVGGGLDVGLVKTVVSRG